MTGQSPTGYSIVCVDDDLPMLRSLREQLLRGVGAGCTIELATSGAEALQLLAELGAEGIRVPLLISDHIMPGMRGAELLSQAHQLYPDMLTILLTGQADVDAVGHAVNHANLYRLLTKPWHEGDLIRTVREALRRCDQEQQLTQRTLALAEASERLEASLQLLQATMDATLDGVLVLDQEGVPVQANRQFEALWNVPEALALAPPGAALLDHLRAQLRDPASMALGPQCAAEAPVVLELKDGRAVDYVCRVHWLHGQPVGTVYSFRDVTERERSARIVRHQALHDTLSGLPNRLQFTEVLEQAIVQAREINGGLAVLFVDLDHFKRINDSRGHDFGDKLLKCAAQRLASCLRAGDMIARWGGDEFTVLAPRLRGPGEGAALAARLIAALEAPFVLEDLSLRISASIGVASYPADGDNGGELLRRADMALYRAKAEGRNGYQQFRHVAPIDRHDNGELSLETELRLAMERGELQLHYQPQFDTCTGRVTSVEALARWHHPERGWVPPAIFIALAERTGMIVALGEWVLHTACRQAVAWRDQGLGDVCVAVNLSPLQFDRGDVEATVRQALSSSGLAPQALELEVTEAVALRHLDTSAATLESLQRSGVRIALDDFGVGYASLTYLKQLPCDTLKIDRSFTSGLQAGSKDAAIIGALVALSDALGLRLVAEGVETTEVASLLQRLGCRTMQGYLLGRPVEPHQLTWLLRDQPCGAAILPGP